MLNNKNILLYPFSLLYGLITSVRNFLYNKGLITSSKFDLPIICVGNISVGGTGKTPHTEYIIKLLENTTHNIAILSRGYKRKTSDFQLASQSSKVSHIGDEPMQMFLKFPRLVVATDRDRVNGINMILNEIPETEVIILDDGFQHRRVTPGLSIVLSDFSNPISEDHLMPFGSLRESKNNLKRADIILITKSPHDLTSDQRQIISNKIKKTPHQYIFFTSLRYLDPVPLFIQDENKIQHNEFRQSKENGILLVTGIANPEPLKEYLKQFSDEIVHLSFSDHHDFKDNDIEKLSKAFRKLRSEKKYIFTTEKDAVRLKEMTTIPAPLKSLMFYIPVEVYFLNGDKDIFDNLIVDYVKKNKRDHRIS